MIERLPGPEKGLIDVLLGKSTSPNLQGLNGAAIESGVDGATQASQEAKVAEFLMMLAKAQEAKTQELTQDRKDAKSEILQTKDEFKNGFASKELEKESLLEGVYPEFYDAAWMPAGSFPEYAGGFTAGGAHTVGTNAGSASDNVRSTSDKNASLSDTILGAERTGNVGNVSVKDGMSQNLGIASKMPKQLAGFSSVQVGAGQSANGDLLRAPEAVLSQLEQAWLKDQQVLKQDRSGSAAFDPKILQLFQNRAVLDAKSNPGLGHLALDSLDGSGGSLPSNEESAGWRLTGPFISSQDFLENYSNRNPQLEKNHEPEHLRDVNAIRSPEHLRDVNAIRSNEQKGNHIFDPHGSLKGNFLSQQLPLISSKAALSKDEKYKDISNALSGDANSVMNTVPFVNVNTNPSLQHSGIKSPLGNLADTQGLQGNSLGSGRIFQESQRLHALLLSSPIQSLAAAGGGSIKVKIEPEHLGELVISVQSNARQLNVQFEASSPEAHELLLNTLPELKQVLASQNYEIGNLEVRSQHALLSHKEQSWGGDKNSSNNGYADSSVKSAWDQYLSQADWQRQNSHGRNRSAYQLYEELLQ